MVRKRVAAGMMHRERKEEPSAQKSEFKDRLINAE
jgi:hypothetical protein